MPFWKAVQRLRQELAGFGIREEDVVGHVIVGVSVRGWAPQVMQGTTAAGTERHLGAAAGGEPLVVEILGNYGRRDREFGSVGVWASEGDSHLGLPIG